MSDARCAVVTFSTGRRWLTGLTNPFKVRYCEARGYDFVFEEARRFPERFPAWEKVAAVREALRRYEVVMWMDDDAVPMDVGKGFEGFVEDVPGVWMAVARDGFMSPMEGRLHCNTGVWVMRRCEESLAFLDVWGSAAVFERFKGAKLWEQSAFQGLVGEGMPGLRVVSASELNAFDQGSMWHVGAVEEGWRPGDFALHFAGARKRGVQDAEGLRLRLEEAAAEEVCGLPWAVVSGAGEMIPGWCASWLGSGNVLPVHFYDDGTWSREVRAVAARTGTLHDAREVYAVAGRGLKGALRRHAGWAAKTGVMRLARSRWAVWFDHDVEVQGSVEEMVRYAMREARWFASPLYGSFCDLYARTRLAQHGVMVYRPDAEEMVRWAGYALSCGDPNDEKNFVSCFGGIEAAREQVCDLYRPEWYDSPDVVKGRDLRRMAGYLGRSTAATVHWCSPVLKAPMVEHVCGGGGEYGGLNATGQRCEYGGLNATDQRCEYGGLNATDQRCEYGGLNATDQRCEYGGLNATDQRCEGGGGVPRGRDVVFVLGSGSRSGNEELRYALRSVARFCRWVRKVWVVGDDPGFLAPEVGFLPARDLCAVKDANIVSKVLVAARCAEVAEEFLVCSDDQVVMRDSSWEDFGLRWVREFVQEDGWYEEGVNALWRRRLRATLMRFGEGAKVYEPHIWTPVTKSGWRRMCEGVDLRKAEDVTVFSWWGNFMGGGGVRCHDHAVVGVDGRVRGGVRHVSYGEKGWTAPGFRALLGAMFPMRGRYECAPRLMVAGGRVPEGGDALYEHCRKAMGVLRG